MVEVWERWTQVLHSAWAQAQVLELSLRMPPESWAQGSLEWTVLLTASLACCLIFFLK